MKRRQIIQSLLSFSILSLVPSFSFSADKKAGKKSKTPAKKKAEGAKNLMDEKDTLASAMQYKHDASTSGPMRTNKKAFCNNCAKYNVCMDGDKDCKPLSAKNLKTADTAPCQIFKGKVVKGKGWCLSWQAKG